MEERLLEFASVLRRNGIRVSLSENMDAFRALELIGIGDPGLFRHTLRTTLVKRASDVKPFEELFDYFFLGKIGRASCRDRVCIWGVGCVRNEERAWFPLE